MYFPLNTVPCFWPLHVRQKHGPETSARCSPLTRTDYAITAISDPPFQLFSRPLISLVCTLHSSDCAYSPLASHCSRSLDTNHIEQSIEGIDQQPLGFTTLHKYKNPFYLDIHLLSRLHATLTDSRFAVAMVPNKVYVRSCSTWLHFHHCS